jgi:hypothetical protein
MAGAKQAPLESQHGLDYKEIALLRLNHSTKAQT